MAQMSRAEINVRRLLTRCESLAEEDHKDWKLEKYIQALDSMMNELQTLPDKPSKDAMMGYTKRINFLKEIISAMNLSTPVERVTAAQLLSKNPASMDDFNSANITTQIHQKTIAKCNRDLRADLFHTDAATKDGVRKRMSSSGMQEEDLDVILKHNRNVQEKIAANMLLMTSNMKEHALAASAIIKKDIDSLDKSDKLTNINAAKLKTESLKIGEHTKSKWRCWLWLMIAFVLAVFFNMVLFMKVARKKVGNNSYL